MWWNGDVDVVMMDGAQREDILTSSRDQTVVAVLVVVVVLCCVGDVLRWREETSTSPTNTYIEEMFWFWCPNLKDPYLYPE